MNERGNSGLELRCKTLLSNDEDCKAELEVGSGLGRKLWCSPGKVREQGSNGMGQKPPREGATSGFKLPRRVHTSPALCIFFFDELKDSGTKTSPHSIRISLSPTMCRSVLGLTILLVLPPIPTPQPPKMRPQRPLPSFKHRPKLLPLRPIHPRSSRRYRQSSAHPMSSQQLEPNSPIPLKWLLIQIFSQCPAGA